MCNYFHITVTSIVLEILVFFCFVFLQRNLRSLERAVESSQRSIEEPDSVRLPEEELNLGLQQSTSSETSIPPPPSQPPKPNEHIVEVVVERADVTSTSSEKINEIQSKYKI